MPNYVMNRVIFSGLEDDINRMKQEMQSSESYFDFNCLVPQPTELDMPSGPEEDYAIEVVHAFHNGMGTCKAWEEHEWMKDKHSFRAWAKIGEQYLRNEELYGARTWYEWRRKNWGCKWNACEIYWESDNELTFETPWHTPEPVFRALSEKYPEIHFDVYYADEDLGCNCGRITFDGENFWQDSDEDFEFACEVWNLDPEEVREEREEE